MHVTVLLHVQQSFEIHLICRQALEELHSLTFPLSKGHRLYSTNVPQYC